MQQLSSKYENLYLKLLESVGHNYRPRRAESASLSPFWPAVGRAYARGEGILIVGRATNGWLEGGAPLREFQSEADRKSLARRAQEAAASLDWLSEPHASYNLPQAGRRRVGGSVASRSAFWRVSRVLTAELLPGRELPEAWPQTIAWSNLAKVAPARGGNPTWKAYEAQWPYAGELVRLEAEELQPAVVLVLGGDSWPDPLLAALGAQRPAADAGMFAFKQATGGPRWVFAGRPEYKAERPFVEMVVAVATTSSQ